MLAISDYLVFDCFLCFERLATCMLSVQAETQRYAAPSLQRNDCQGQSSMLASLVALVTHVCFFNATIESLGCKLEMYSV